MPSTMSERDLVEDHSATASSEEAKRVREHIRKILQRLGEHQRAMQAKASGSGEGLIKADREDDGPEGVGNV
jgi:hypothetical protein